MLHSARSMGLAAGLAAVILAGCGAGAPTEPPTPAPATTAPVTPAPTIAPTPTPTPDPLDLALQRFEAKDLRAHVLLEGTADYGGTSIVATGTMDVIGDSEHETYETKVNGKVVETKEVISIGREEWERLDSGPWHDSDGTNDTAIVDDLAKVTALTVVGQETVDGVRLVHVRPGPGVPVEQDDWGPTGSSVTDYSITLDLWIAPDGTLARLEQHERWMRPSGKTSIAVKSDTSETFTPLAASAAIAKPQDAWVANVSSAMGYTISQPAGYSVTAAEAAETYTAGDRILLSIASGPIEAGTTLDAVVAALMSSYADQVQASLLNSYDARVDGLAAKVAVFKAKDPSGADIRVVDAVIVAGGKYWEIWRVGFPDTMEADVDHVRQSLTTFEFAS